MFETHFWGYKPQSHSIELKSAELPTLKKEEVLVRNHAIGINPVDWKFINTNPLQWKEDHIPGVDGAGEIIAVGDENNAHFVGKRVCYHTFLKENGSFATHSLIKTERLMLLPDLITYAVAASLPCPMLTAFQSFEKIPIKRGRSALIAGLGAVTKILTQILVKQGMIVDVISTFVDENEAKSLGIRHIFRNQEVVNQHYFAAFDAVSGQNAASLVKHLRANGHIVCIQDRINSPVDPAFTRTISYHEIALGALHEFGDRNAWYTLMKNGEMLLNEIKNNQLIIQVPIEFSFQKMQKALSYSEKNREKTVVIIDKE